MQHAWVKRELPVDSGQQRLAFRLAVTGVLAIIAAMTVGPMFSPTEFSWVAHSTSEQAGQHLPGAWIMRSGFVAYGLGTLAAATLTWHRRSWVSAALALFGIGLVATAIWSNAPIVPDLPVDLHQDWLHSIASAVVGTAFAAACAARLFLPGGQHRDRVAWCGLIISVLVPMAMGWLPELRGLLQRAMFAYSFLFVLREFRPG
ncbi:DUF998 domain-containing protein [Parerythrobacter aestuarii]|uniref:DUF998 domain-containing protein n=1 Tax=Parerythrobacter aestuarii TaxID=3020909 RepID=UPI002DD6A3A1|nr:DUF998 domain-containing protein [Parerythrobacter aestuarii]